MKQKIVVLTGAGISQESGLETFRDLDGLWNNYNLEELATPQAYQENPDRVLAFYNFRREKLLTKAPNKAHEALVTLEKHLGTNFTLITQNVDDLHERAGSTNIIHMHGELLKSRCTSCEHIFKCTDNLSLEDICSHCAAKGTLRPHVVWFNEMPLYMDQIYELLSQCDVFISIGTSGSVYPAADFVNIVKQTSYAHSINVNLEKSLHYNAFDENRYGKATELVPALIKEILDEKLDLPS